jgi:hypothetical protein
VIVVMAGPAAGDERAARRGALRADGVLAGHRRAARRSPTRCSARPTRAGACPCRGRSPRPSCRWRSTSPASRTTRAIRSGTA